jgi:hypothetical protein
MHLDWLAVSPPPETFQYACSTGVIDLAVSTDESGRDVAHRFRGCEVKGLRISGSFDYQNVERCMPSGIDISIVGVLEVEGDITGECEVNVHEDCSGGFTGEACGSDPSGFSSADI